MGRRPDLVIVKLGSLTLNANIQGESLSAEYSDCNLVHPVGIPVCDTKTYPDTVQCKFYRSNTRYLSPSSPRRCDHMYRKTVDKYSPDRAGDPEFICDKYISIPGKSLKKLSIKKYSIICQSRLRSIYL